MDEELAKQLDQLNRTIDSISNKIEKPRSKSWLDIASIATTFLSGVVIASLIGWWTNDAKKRELTFEKMKHDQASLFQEYDLELKRLKQRTEDIDKSQRREIYALEIIERFVPYVADSPEQRQIALIALSELGQETLSNKFSELYDDDETKKAVDYNQSTSLPVGQQEVPKAILSAGVEESSSKSKGWVYLGHYDQGDWKTQYLNFKEDVKPSALSGNTYQVWEKTGALNVRSGPPGLFGKVKKVIGVLAEGSEVILIGDPETTLSGYVWHEIEYVGK